MPVAKALNRPINEYFDFFLNTFAQPAGDQKHDPAPSQAVNTLGEVPDSAWYTNRRLSIEEMVRGPGDSKPPATDKPWSVLSGKNEGITPGLVIRDCAGRRYFLKFDPMSNPELASAADIMGSKFFYALGYNTPENYIVHFTRAQLVPDPKSKFRNPSGRDRAMKPSDIDAVLHRVPRDKEGRYRALASLPVEGEVLGPFRYFGTRKDDPNDVVEHQNRRDLRGLYVFAAWLNHTDTKSINSMDTLVEEGGVRLHSPLPDRLRRHPRQRQLRSQESRARATSTSTTSSRPPGSSSLWASTRPAGCAPISRPFLPRATSSTRSLRSVALEEQLSQSRLRAAHARRHLLGREEGRCSSPTKRSAPLSPPRQYTRPEGRRAGSPAASSSGATKSDAPSSSRLPLDNFAVRDGTLMFDDLAVKHGYAEQRQYYDPWSSFDNAANRKSPIAGATGPAVPRSDSPYLAADIHSRTIRAETVTVYLRQDRVVGIDRTW